MSIKKISSTLRDMALASRENTDGGRPLSVSVLFPEVYAALVALAAETPGLLRGSRHYCLIGGIALSHYVKPRTTTDIDVLFLHSKDTPVSIPGFKRLRTNALLHLKTHVEVETLDPAFLKMDTRLAAAIIDNANVVAVTAGTTILIASVEGLVLSKLQRFSLQDRADIHALLTFGADMGKSWVVPFVTKDLAEKLARLTS